MRLICDPSKCQRNSKEKRPTLYSLVFIRIALRNSKVQTLHYSPNKSKTLYQYLLFRCPARSVFNIHKFLFIASNYETIYRCSFIRMHFMMITANINGIQLTRCHKLSHQMRYLICQRILSSFLPNFTYVFKFARHTTTIYTCSISNSMTKNTVNFTDIICTC